MPIHEHEKPAARAENMNEPIAVTSDERHVYVGSYNVGTIYTYDLPLSDGSSPQLFEVGNGGVSSLALSGRYIYAALPTGVLEYRLPLVKGEQPSGQISGYGPDFIGLASRNGTLFVASSVKGTVSGYHLPLRHAPPYITIQMKPEINSSVRLVVNLGDSDLYVTRTWDANLYAFRLPFQANEVPTIVPLPQFAGGLSVSRDHIFVAFDKAVWAYQLPLTPSSKRDASLHLPNGAAGLSVSE